MLSQKQFCEIASKDFSVKELIELVGGSVSRANEVKKINPHEQDPYYPESLYNYLSKQAGFEKLTAETLAEMVKKQPHAKTEIIINIAVGEKSILGEIVNVATLGKYTIVQVKNDKNEIINYSKTDYEKMVKSSLR